MRNIWKWFIGISVFGGTILGIILGESWIAGLVFFFGFFWGALILTLISILVSWIIVYVFSLGDKPKGAALRIQNWIRKKEKNLSPVGLKLAKTSKFLGLIVSSITAGPFITTIFIKTLGYNQKQSYLLALVSSVIFSLVWSAIYSGAISGIRLLIEGWI
jgi:hypothetical protein